jgi:trehalose 6-phosphate synthase
MLKEANPNLIIAQFWHIPWPNREFIRTFPWRDELLDGLLGNDLLGFHLRYHCQNFLETIDRTFEAMVDQERSEVTRGGKLTVVRPFPISIDYDQHSLEAQSEAVEQQIARFRETLGLADLLVGVGIERIDYTKGIPERLRGLDRLFEKYPQYRGKLVFVQVGVPSRSHIDAYKRLEDEIDNLVDLVNWNWSTDEWRPIIFLKQQCGLSEMMALHRIANFAIVSSLHDGLNLVAKEFVASRNDDDGVLILSEFTGAARELTDALLINPYGVDQVADAIHTALEMPEAERQKRMRRLREAVAGNNVYRWAGKILSALLKFDFPEES